jgi:hypothetical protein
MQIKFQDHIVIQNLFEGEIAIVNMEISLTSFWSAKGFAADVVRLIQQNMSKENLIQELELSYRGSHDVIEKNLDQVLDLLNQEKMLKNSKRKSSLLAKTVLKSIGSKSKSKSKPKIQPKRSSGKKKKIEWSFERRSTGSSEVLPAYAQCFSDADCGPGQTCIIGADWCLNFCTTS